MSVESIVPLLVVVLGSGGLVGGIYALLKLRPEAGQIVVTAAQGALVVQTGVIESLRAENVRLVARQAEDAAEIRHLRQRVEQLEVELVQLRREVRNGHPDPN